VREDRAVAACKRNEGLDDQAIVPPLPVAEGLATSDKGVPAEAITIKRAPRLRSLR